MRREISLLCAAALSAASLSLASCGGGTDSGGGHAVACMNATIVAKESTNYSFSSTLTFPPIKVKPNSELTFDWSGVTKDFIGHTLDAKADLNLILTMLWELPLAQLQTKLNADALMMSDLAILPLSITTDGKMTAAPLFSFTLNGNPVPQAQLLPYFDPAMYPPATHIYTVMAASGTQLGQGTRMIQSYELDPASTNTMVKLTNDSTQLTYSANLHSLTSIGVTAKSAAITLDWGKMTTNALGNTFIPTNITNAMVGHYTQTPAELEAKFLDLELIATDLYRAEIAAGTVLDFSTLKNKSGKAFAGIDADGTWVVALQCGQCRNPAPWYLTILKPC